MPRILLTAALLLALPLALPSTLTAQDSANKPKTDSGTSKVIASINTDVLAARKANAEHRYGDAEALMLKDLADHPAMVIPRVELALAEMGMEKYDDAALNFKKALGIDFKIDASSSSDNFYATPGTSEIQATRASRNTAGGEVVDLKKDDPEIVGAAWSGLGEVYIRQKHYPEAKQAFDSAAQANPAKAGLYLSNETIFFFKAGNQEAQLAAAEKAIAADPARANMYYFKAQALVSKATMDPATQKMVLPPGCADAYKKYLQLDPNGPYSSDAKSILGAAGIPVPAASGKKS
jgi:tetratricopeptide (TPR) repeat protein